MKGITPVVTILLLLTLSITLVSFSFVFFNSIYQKSAEESQKQIEQQTKGISSYFRIESVYGNAVYIRNLGTSDLTDLVFYVNDILVNASGSLVPSGQMGVFILDFTGIPNPQKIKVSGKSFSQTINIAVTTSSSTTTASTSSSTTSTTTTLPSLMFDDKRICSLLNLTTGNNAHITGQDGGESLPAEGKSLWTFGDTTVDFLQGFFINTNAATSTDFDAANCIDLNHKVNSTGYALPLMSANASVNPQEFLVWAGGMASVQAGYVHTFYMSVEPCNNTVPGCILNTFLVGGVGLAKINTTTLNTTRIGGLIWNNDNIPFVKRVENPMTFTHGGYVYIFLDQRVARVSAVTSQLENPSNYQYWNSTAWANNFSQAVDLWQAQADINGLSVSFNNYLGKYVAVYTTGTPQFNYTLLVARTADNITGPWSSEIILVNCLDYFSLSTLTCYSGNQHSEYQKNNGEAIYITHANDKDYRIFLYSVNFSQPNTEKMINITSKAVQKIYQSGVPHTDKLGNPRTSYDPTQSFFPVGIFWLSNHSAEVGSVPVLSNAGFNTAVLTRDANTTFFTNQIDGKNDYIVLVSNVSDLFDIKALVAINSTNSMTNITVTDPDLINGVKYQYYICTPNCGGMRVTSGNVTAVGNTVSLAWDNGSAFKVIINQDLIEDPNNNSNPASFNETLFQSYKNDPRVFGWLIDDEPLNRAIVHGINPQNNYDANNQVYQNHKNQTSQVLFIIESIANVNISWWNSYLNLGDTASIYFYPKHVFRTLPIPTFEDVGNYTKNMTAVINASKPAWYTPQAYTDAWGPAKVRIWLYPTPAEEKAQVFASIIHGATGIIYFTWDNCEARSLNSTLQVAGIRSNTPIIFPDCNPNSLNLTGTEANASRDLWNSLDATQNGLNKQLQDLTPVILSPTSTLNYEVYVNATPVTSAPIRTILKDYNGNKYLLAINVDNTHLNAKFRFFVPVTNAEVMFENRTAFFYNNEIRDSFKPFEVHVYKIS